MSVMIRIRNVPDPLHRRLKVRAALAGMSLSDYLIAELRRSLERPTRSELLERLAQRTPVKARPTPAAVIRRERAETVIVLDASAVLELLLVTPTGSAIARRIASPNQTLHVPHVLDLEIAQALRRYVRGRQLSEARALEALQDLQDLDVRYPHDLLLARIWELRDNVSAYLPRAGRAVVRFRADVRLGPARRSGGHGTCRGDIPYASDEDVAVVS